MKNDVTIAICLHKRIGYLSELIQRLSRQQTAPPFELLCILNQSPADVAAAVRAVLSRFDGQARVLEEPELGLSHARNRAIVECHTPWLAFLDDDAIPRENWLAMLISEAMRVNAKAAGGKTILRWDFERPTWFKPEHEKWFSCVDLGLDTRPLNDTEYIVGANTLYHTDIFRDGLRFDVRLGRVADDLISDEETALNKIIRQKGNKVYYIGSAIVEHIVDSARVTPQWIAERIFAQGRSFRVRYGIYSNKAEFKAETDRRLSAFWAFLSDFANYSSANSHKWRDDFAMLAGYAWQHYKLNGYSVVDFDSKEMKNLAALAEDWGRRQFDFFFSHQIAQLPAGYSVAIVGGGITGKWVYDLCEKAGVRVVVILDDYVTGQLTPLPVVPINCISQFKVDTVILATLRNEQLIKELLSKAGYKGPVICQVKPNHQGVRTASVFPLSSGAKPRDGLPGRDWPVNVQIETTSVCNARCIICPYVKSWNMQNPGFMSEELRQKILSDLESYHIGKLCLYLQNEPMCDKNWFQTAGEAVKRLKFDRFEISTNASLLNTKRADELCSLLKNIPHEVWISFQGADHESYERIMGLKLDQTLNNLEYFLKLAAKEELAVRVHGFGAPRDPKGKGEKLFTREAYNAFLNKFADERGIPRFPVRFYLYHDRAGQLSDKRFSSGFRRESLQGFYCHRLDTWLHILYTGHVTGCCNDFNRELLLGNLNHQTIKEYFRSEPYKTFRDKGLGLLPSEPDFMCKRCAAPGG